MMRILEMDPWTADPSRIFPPAIQVELVTCTVKFSIRIGFTPDNVLSSLMPLSAYRSVFNTTPPETYDAVTCSTTQLDECFQILNLKSSLLFSPLFVPSA